MAHLFATAMRIAVSIIAAAFFGLVAPPVAAEALSIDDARERLAKAFENLYDCDLRPLLRVTLHNRRGETSTRTAEIARKRIRGRLHSYGRFLSPSWMRDTAMLIVDREDKSDEHFLFLPDERRVRRMTSVQRTDAFLGSDLWFEDLERRTIDQYAVLAASKTSRQGEAVTLVRAEPVRASTYEHVEFAVADFGSPTLVRDPKDDSALYVLMPMRV